MPEVVGADGGSIGEITCVSADSLVVSADTGDIRPRTRDGVYLRDIRFLDRLELRVGGARPRPLSGTSTGGGSATFHAWIADEDAPTAEPTLLVTRHRRVEGGLREEITLDNHGSAARDVVVDLACAADFAYVFDVRNGRRSPAAAPTVPSPGRLRFERRGGVETASVAAVPPAEAHQDGLRWRIALPARGTVRLCVEVTLHDGMGPASPPVEVNPPGPAASTPSVRCSDQRLDALVERSLIDLAALRLRDVEDPTDVYYGAGAPWYLTLFGRDALWAAFMALPFDRTVAGGTLRALARRQGRRHDPETEEAPGKILHEFRGGPLVERGDLPPTYYGTIDATPLFVVLLHEAWSWGLADEELTELATALEGALGWMRAAADESALGLLTYERHGPRGLDNQGWKDSPDALQFADGRRARPPVALLEVQGYAYDAARRGAALLDHLGRPGADAWREWADRLRARVHERFWVRDATGAYLAAAVDGDGRAVDAPASNMGHVLATGLLDRAQSRLVADRLAHPSLDSGWGLRTMATTAAGYHPVSYHCGSVWPHDTAVAVRGCAVTGNDDVAAALATGLVRASPAFSHRLPELFAGFGRDASPEPVPYHDACRPQAWSAAAALLLVRSVLGMEADVPGGTVTLGPLDPLPFDRLEVRDLVVGEGRLDAVVHADGRCDVDLRGTDLRVEVRRH